MRFDREMKDLLKMGMVKMGKDAEKVLIDMLSRVCE